MNAEQITERLNSIKESLSDFQEQLDIFDRAWEAYPNQGTLDACMSNLEDGAYELHSFFSEFDELVKDLREVRRDGLEPSIEFPESARHLWVTMDTCREIYCERNGYPRMTPGDMLPGLTDGDPVSPLFTAVAMGKRLHRNLTMKIIDRHTFELDWRAHVINPVADVEVFVQDTSVRDCLDYVGEALPAEVERNRLAIAQGTV